MSQVIMVDADSREDYCTPDEVQNIRIYFEPYQTSGDGDWNMDGISADGGYTEEVWDYPTLEAALAEVAVFCEWNGIPEGRPIQVCRVEGGEWEMI